MVGSGRYWDRTSDPCRVEAIHVEGVVGSAYVPICAGEDLYSIGTWAYDGSWTVEVEMRDTIMWVTGIVLALLAAGLMVWSDTDAAPLTVLLVLGVTFIAVGARGRRSQDH
jgi:hypothetical protein